MGMLGKLITGNVAAKLVNKAIEKHEAKQVAKARAGQYIPAGAAEGTVMPARGATLADRAGAIYRNNPKTVGLAGIALGIAALALMKRKT